MILVCPACQTRYQIDEQAVGRPSGRTVRCASCSHSWHHMPPPPASPMRASAAAHSSSSSSSRLPSAPVTMPRPAITLPLSPRQRRRGAGLGWLVLLILLVAAAAAAYVERDGVVTLWPQAARLYDALGVKTGSSDTAPVGQGLDIGKVASTRGVDGLIVEGEVINSAAAARSLPRLRVALRDAQGNEITSKIIAPPVARLPPGASAHFATIFESASDLAVGIVVTFAPD